MENEERDQTGGMYEYFQEKLDQLLEPTDFEIEVHLSPLGKHVGFTRQDSDGKIINLTFGLGGSIYQGVIPLLHWMNGFKAAIDLFIQPGDTVFTGYAPRTEDGVTHLNLASEDFENIVGGLEEAGFWGESYKLVPVVIIQAADSRVIDPPETEDE
jgi:hypothetical protein